MQQEPFNGSTAFIIYKLGRMEISVENNTRDVRGLTRRLDTMERLPRFNIPFKDLGGFFAGGAILLAAMAHRWDVVLAIAHELSK